MLQIPGLFHLRAGIAGRHRLLGGRPLAAFRIRKGLHVVIVWRQ